MKKFFYIIITIIFMLSLTACTQSKDTSKSNSTAKKITGKIVKANLNDDGNIIIKTKDITTKAMYISYEYEGVTIGLLAVRDSKNNVKVVVNTCQSCGGAPNAYFVQLGNKIQCQNCKNMFAIDELDNLEDGGCNPIAIKDKKIQDGVITIGVDQLKELKDKFKNWNGPKHK